MDYSSLGTVTGACHAPVAGGQGKALADTAPRIPVPIEKPADFEMDGGEDFQNSLCLWAAALKQVRLLKGWRSRRGFCRVGTTCKPRQRLPQKPHSPFSLGEPTILCSRRMKVSQWVITLPQKCSPESHLVLRNLKSGGKCPWQEATVFIVPTQEI